MAYEAVVRPQISKNIDNCSACAGPASKVKPIRSDNSAQKIFGLYTSHLLSLCPMKWRRRLCAQAFHTALPSKMIQRATVEHMASSAVSKPCHGDERFSEYLLAGGNSATNEVDSKDKV